MLDISCDISHWMAGVCAEQLHPAGYAWATAVTWRSWCSDPNPAEKNRTFGGLHTLVIPKLAGWFISWKIPIENGWWLGVPLFQETFIQKCSFERYLLFERELNHFGHFCSLCSVNPKFWTYFPRKHTEIPLNTHPSRHTCAFSTWNEH